MAKIFPNSNTVAHVLSIAILLSGTMALSNQACAQGGGLSYEEALKALQKTKKHSQAAKNWGERRTIPVPKGVDPNALIKKEVIKVPGVNGISGPTSPKNVNPIKVKGVPVKATKNAGAAPVPTQTTNTKKQAGGWDWLSSQKGKTNAATQAQAPAPTPAPVPKPAAAAPKVTTPAQTTTTATAPVPVQAKPAPKTSHFQTVKKSTSTMKTVYEAPVTSKPKTTQSDNLLGLEKSKPATTTKAASKPAQVTPVTTPPVTRQSKESASDFYNRAVKAHLQGKLSEAIADYSAALRADPKFANAHCNLGQIYNQQHHFDMAIEEFRKALAINPKDEHSYNGLGASMRGKKNYAEAIKNWKQAVSLKPDLATAHYNLGAVYEVQKEFDKALLAYEQAVKHDYRLGEANYRIGLIMTKKKRLDEAKEQFSKALKVSEKASYSEDARKRLAKLEQISN